MTEQVSDEQLLEDIKNTKIELDAYRKLHEGFEALALLPENAGSNKSKYVNEHVRYFDLMNQCHMFINRLMQIKKERGIE